MRAASVSILLAAATSVAAAEPIRVDASLGLTHFQQQVKTEVGAVRGDRLVEHNALTLAVNAGYRVHPAVAVVAFADLDLGTRRAGELTGFDASGAPITDPQIGGDYLELWSGLAVRGHYRFAFLELGYPLLARRWDRGRPDLRNADGQASGAFAPTLNVRWVAALGATIPIRSNLAVTLRLQWRIRYYDERDGAPLADDIVHGTQEMRPLFGLAWTP